MIPELEAELLCNSVAAALDRVHAGNVEMGYRELAYGLQRARVMAEEEDWGPEVVGRWELALRNYTWLHLGRN